ncbi:amino acid adenylation domain-containing protein [Lysobacter koreensis]|uniref:Amino acid adenylation domain-containing protein n=1 Tax=Lysobacter koreensis TaxID=266122 RepID=A0ABW2YLB4_9GAMM
MNTRAEPTEAAIDELPLLDVLPVRAHAIAGAWQHRVFELDALPADAVCGWLKRHDHAADALLLAALALVESRLAGARRVLVTRIAEGAVAQGCVEVEGHGSCDQWLAATPTLVAQVAGNPSPAAWAALDAASLAAAAPEPVVSTWRLAIGETADAGDHAEEQARLEITFRAPLDADAIALLAGCVQRALAALVAGVAPAQIDVLDPAERHRLLVEWNSPAVSRPTGDSVVTRFAAIRDAHGASIAVTDASTTLTYTELDRRADTLARQLREAGVASGAIVGVAMERSVAAVVAVLGVLKAGAAYLPLDLAHPASRLAFMLEDAGAEVVVVDGRGPKPPLPAAIRLVDIGGGTEAPLSPTDHTDPEPDGAALAYVMYTSGSTGTPKGVEIPHRAILRLVCEVAYIDLGPDTRMLHAAPLGFDASTLEIWGALLNGGCVVVHGEALPSGAGLAATIAGQGVTTAWLTAALFNAVVDKNPRQLAGLRQLFTGGEALSVDHVRRMRATAPDTQLHNGYGPTECTTFTCTYAIPAEVPAGTSAIPIGRPIADTQLYVLNARAQPVPVGVLGELYVGGAGLARGYLKRPQLSGERFVANPFGEPGERLYRTGDQVRYRTDGVVEFVGRADTQVKIRGFRIELGEIESVLGAHPGVQSCAVVACANGRGDKRLVAYYVAGDALPTAQALRAHLGAALPEFMVPARYLRLEALPVTPNGKLDRRALPAPDDARPELANAYEAPGNATESRICAHYGALLDIAKVGRHDNFFELGGNSLLAMRLLELLRADRSANNAGAGEDYALAAISLFRNPTPATLAAALDGRAANAIDPARMAPGAIRSGDATEDDPIAIIAMAGRFPGAADVEAFWDNLCEGRDSITVFAPDELDPSIGAAERDDPAYVPARGVIDGVELFDAGFFGISAKEAELMDPQQRIFLELCWECMERGGQVPDASTGPVGVFAGMYNASYFQRHVVTRPDLIDKLGAFQVMLGNEKDYVATRVAHKLNLTGPAISVHTACSTSLVAICQAVASLRAGQCDMALAGGASVTCPPRSGYLYQEGAMLSPDGHTRSFDARAQGTVFSDGAAVVLLKRLSDARADGNPVYAVIRGGAINNDGGHKASFTAPSSDGQAAVIAMAHANARVDPRSISYVETHGTATPLGDPIEIEGLTRAFRRGTDDVGFCTIGSVKSNVGHTVIAAGAAGVIKTALALAQRRIPGTAHFEHANPVIDFASSPFVVNGGLIDWPDHGAPRRAGVSSFGVGGTNAHAVLEEAPAAPVSEPAHGPQLLVLSARTPAALGQAMSNLATHLESNAEANLADVAWTLATGRKAFAHRIAVVADDVAAAAAALRDADTVSAAARSRPARSSEVVFLFPGQGATYPGMGRGLHASEPAFRAAFDECAEALRGELGFDLRERVFGDDPDALLPTAVMQPATFAIEYALAKLWMSVGLTPAAMVGHSVGEFVAATLAGVFALRDALRLVARRGALMQAQPAGAMVSVRMPLDALLPRLPAQLSLAAENAPGACVVAGPLDAVARFQAALEADGVACRALRTSHAFHSAMMEPMVAPFLAEVAATARAAPRLPLVSTASGEWLDADTATSPAYWARHLREPVRFAAALGRALEEPARVLLEVGPRASLCGLARQHPLVQKQSIGAVATLADTPASEPADFRKAAGQLWCRGVAVDPAVFDRRGVRQRLRLPTYPFERQRYWLEAAVATPSTLAPAVPQPAAATITPQSVVASATTLEPVMSPSAPAAAANPAPSPSADRKPRLVAQLKDLFEDVAGFDLADADADANFIELGLDSLMLTQVALQLQRSFPVKITFRQLMGECASLDKLAAMLDAQLPAEAIAAAVAPTSVIAPAAAAPVPAAVAPAAMPTPMPIIGVGDDFARQLIAQQMQLMSQQLALLSGSTAAGTAAPAFAPAVAAAPTTPAPPTEPPPVAVATPDAPDAAAEEAALAHTQYDVKKAFGAIARIHNSNANAELSGRQRARLDAFMRRYIARTQRSKDYTQEHRSHLADPRVVNGFRPLLKEITYQVVVGRSQGSRVWDLDGNEYIDVLNGFGMNLFGWQPEFVLNAVKRQLDLGYEIGPQHPLAGEVARLVCELTGFARAGLCNTGSEAVMGTIRIARTVTGRNTLVIFTGSYHGIFDEVIVRGTKTLRSIPAAPGILRNTAEHVLVLDYGTPESLQIIRERAHEIAAVLVEPVQSRRPDFQPREFLQELRTITRDAGALLIFDEVVTGFRADPRGAQEVLGIDADLAAYGKVVGGGFPIGVIAGKREYMDALDGGYWQFGDDSIPTVGVTYFAGTFVRHPLALAAAKAVLEHLKAAGPALQQLLNARTAAMAGELNAFCEEVGAPIEVKHFASFWKTFFTEEHPLQDLLFAMMRSRGIHILDHFPCFFTTAHSEADFAAIVKAFKESVLELQAAEFIPRRRDAELVTLDANRPPVPGARLGRDADGQPAWFVPHPEISGKFIKVSA